MSSTQQTGISTNSTYHQTSVESTQQTVYSKHHQTMVESKESVARQASSSSKQPSKAKQLSSKARKQLKFYPSPPTHAAWQPLHSATKQTKAKQSITAAARKQHMATHQPLSPIATQTLHTSSYFYLQATSRTLLPLTTCGYPVTPSNSHWPVTHPATLICSVTTTLPAQKPIMGQGGG